MRTTLTIDSDLAAAIELERERTKLSLKEVINRALRAGLSVRGGAPTEPFVVKPYRLGFLPTVDPYRLNQLSDELETADFVAESASEGEA